MRKGITQRNPIWINSLNNVKNELQLKEYTSLLSTMRENNLSTVWTTFLKRKKIIYKNEQGYYKWNEKVPISIKIISAYRKYQHEKNESYRKRGVTEYNLFTTEVIKKEKNIVKDKNIQWITIKDAVKYTKKCDSTLRRLSRELRKSNSENIKYEKLKNGHEKIMFNKEYLSNYYKILTKEITENKKPKNDLGLIRKFLKWLW